MFHDIYLYTLCYYICCLLGACMRCTWLCSLKPGVTENKCSLILKESVDFYNFYLAPLFFVTQCVLLHNQVINCSLPGPIQPSLLSTSCECRRILDRKLAFLSQHCLHHLYFGMTGMEFLRPRRWTRWLWKTTVCGRAEAILLYM
jgi:hypothetical protein